MNVGQEVLRALGQVEDGLQVDDFGTGIDNGGKAALEQLQVAQVLYNMFRSNRSHNLYSI